MEQSIIISTNTKALIFPKYRVSIVMATQSTHNKCIADPANPSEINVCKAHGKFWATHTLTVTYQASNSHFQLS